MVARGPCFLPSCHSAKRDSIIYVDGEEVGTLKAGSHNAAEKKAKAKYPGKQVLVAYTEV